VWRIAMPISRAHSFRQFSLIFFRDIISLFSYDDRTDYRSILNFCKIL